MDGCMLFAGKHPSTYTAGGEAPAPLPPPFRHQYAPSFPSPWPPPCHTVASLAAAGDKSVRQRGGAGGTHVATWPARSPGQSPPPLCEHIQRVRQVGRRVTEGNANWVCVNTQCSSRSIHTHGTSTPFAGHTFTAMDSAALLPSDEEEEAPKALRGRSWKTTP